MSTVILKNLYRGGNNIKQMFRDGEKIYQMFERFIFEVDADSFTFDYEGNTLTLTITASDPWTMTKPEWITASSVSGIGNTTVTLTVPQNPTDDSRDGNIVITCEGRTITVPVEQKGSIGLDTPLTIEVLTGGTIWYYNGSTSSSRKKTIEYKLNNGEWTSISPLNSSASTASTNAFNVEAGDKIEFRGSAGRFNTYYGNGQTNKFLSSTDCRFKVYGNVMSLLSHNFSGLTTIQTTEFACLFGLCTGVVDAENLLLPALNVPQQAYNQMFQEAYNLEKAPVIPAITLTGSYAFSSFIYGSKVTYIKCLALNPTYSSGSNFNTWVTGVPATGTFVKKTGVSWNSGNSGIPSGWTVLEADE